MQISGSSIILINIYHHLGTNKKTQLMHFGNSSEAINMSVATRLNEMVASPVLTKVDAFFVRQATRTHKPTGLHDSEEPSK